MKLKNLKDRKQIIINGIVDIIKRKKKMIALVFTVIILISFWYSAPISKFEFKIRTFNLSPDTSIVRTDEEIQFKWEIQGSPYQAMIIYGDGNVELIDDLSQINGICSGNINHSYALQGKYRPTLRIWNDWGEVYTKSLELEVQNDPPLFDIAINGIMTDEVEYLRLSKTEPSIEVFEDEEITITIENLKDNKGLNLDNMTFIYDYGTNKKNSKSNSMTCSWQKTGVYPLIITAIGSQGELDQQARYVKVKNGAPEASFSLDYEYAEDHVIKVEVDASSSKDTSSDYNTLRYYWDWGDGTTDWGKHANHRFPDSAEYNITLCVRDDDGLYDVCSRVLSINNSKPEIKLIGPENTLALYEGQEIAFNAQGEDDSPNVVRLYYYWNFNSSSFDPEDLSTYELGGWINDHVFHDDYNGFITSAAVDPQGLYDSDSINVEILNVDPKLNMYGVNIINNVTFGLYRNTLGSDLNFTFKLSNQEEKSHERMINFASETSNVVYSDKAQINFDVTDHWTMTVNSSQRIPENEEYQVFAIFEFLDGQTLTLTSNLFVSGEWGYFEDNLSRYFYDSNNFAFKYPLSIAIEVFDPSIDDIYYTMTQTEKKSLEISTTSELPLNDEIYLGDTYYNFQFYQENGKKFVNITATRSIDSKWYDNNSFPVKLEFSNTIVSLINANELLGTTLSLVDFAVEQCLDAMTIIETCVVDDDQGSDVQQLIINTTNAIEIFNLTSRIDSGISMSSTPRPYGRIGSFLETVHEEYKVKFNVKSNEQFADLKGLVYMWDFSDGFRSYDKVTEHSWKKAGIYNITLTIADSRGNIFTDVSTIEVLPKAPEIIGPYSFQGLEGQAITLDVEVYDTSVEDYKLSYEWHDGENNLISTEKSPTFILDSGKYTYQFIVKDSSGMEASCIISVFIHPLSPNLYIANYMYYGAAADPMNPRDTKGELILRAYVYNTLIDNQQISYYWTIRDGKQVYTFTQEGIRQYSEIKFKCTKSTIYQGQVRVVDQDGKEKVQTFQIFSTIDDTFDGISDEFNEMVKASSTDTDGDHLTDEYEINTSHTNYTDPDTDDDLLFDGYDEYNVGEQPLNTDPLDWDTDDDNLADGREYYGWNVTIVYFENTTKFLVTSDPLDNDTDDDGLTDYEEYCAGSHPRMVDSDNDGLDDIEDPNPASWDGDDDALSDSWEVAHGTDPSKSDTDGDGLKDGEEVYGWGNGYNTNPLDADSDHDFAADGAEIQNYLVKLQADEYDDMDERVNLTSPVSLDFSHFFTQAAAAQISFGVAYGEYGENATGSYGVQDDQVANLTIGIVKADDGVLLGVYDTNGSRYFSQVVDISDIMNNVTLGYNYHGEYQIGLLDPNVTSPNDGEFKGTYSFIEDPNNAAGTDISFIDEYQGSGSYPYADIKTLDGPYVGHDHYLMLRDVSSSLNTWGVHNFDDPRSTGTIEFYTNYPNFPGINFGGHNYFYLRSASDTIAFGLEFDLYNNRMQYYDGSWHVFLSSYGNYWLHHCIQFDCNAGTNGEFTWIISLEDGTELTRIENINFANGMASLDEIYIGTTVSEMFCSTSFDAFGFSWDPNYDIGDNFEEERLPYRFLNPGDYLGSYSFENDANNEDPEDWVIYEGSGCNAYVMEELDHHSKVYRMYDGSSGTTNYIRCYNEFLGQTEGTIEMWFRREGTTEVVYVMRIWEDNTLTILNTILKHEGGRFLDAQNNDVGSCAPNTWYHLKAYFNTNTDRFSLWIDGVIVSDNLLLPTPLTDVEVFSIDTRGWGSLGYYAYIDAIGFSWDDDYDLGDNRYDLTQAGCYLEYFELSFSQYLNPNDPDSDDDGIMDGVEMGLLVEGTSTIDYKDTHDFPYSLENETAWWPFDEGEGTEVLDLTENGHDGTINGASWVDGLVGSHALDFDGVNDYVSIPDNDKLDLLEAWTICTWIKRESMNVQHSIVEKYDWLANRGKFALRVTSDNKITAYHISGTSSDSIKSITTINSGEWCFVTATYNSSINTLRVFINGDLENENPSASKPDYLSYNNLFIGARGNDHGTPFNGIIDDVRIYNRSLTEEEVGFLYNNTKGLLISNNASSIIDYGCGNYPGTYSFEGETGETGTDIEGILSTSSANLIVLSEYQDHQAVLKFNNTVAGSFQFDKAGGNQQTSGTIELYHRFTANNPNLYVYLMGDGAGRTRFRTISSNTLQYQTGAYSYSSFMNYYPDTWYHWKITWYSDGKYDFWVDGVKKLDQKSLWYGLGTGINQISFYESLSANDHYFDAVGYSWDPNYDIGDNLNDGALYIEDPQEFQIEIPQIGIVYDASLTINLSSLHDTQGSGKVGITLIKDELNQTLTDPIILQYFAEFEEDEAFLCVNVIDLFTLYNSGVISEVHGKYVLRVKVVSTQLADIFKLSAFSIETDTFVQAGFDDTEAWVTDPGEPDSDFDGWDDYREIYTEATNPLQKDSDQDGAWDKNDRDPHKDILIEILPYYTAFPSQLWPRPTPTLQISVELSFHDDPDETCHIFSQRYIANEMYQYMFPFAWRYSARHFNDKYYLDIDDDFIEQDETIPVTIWGWCILPADPCDYEYVGGTLDYTIGLVGHEQTLEVAHANNDVVQVKIKTLAIERANTIAIFDASSNDFTGHYQEKERTTVFQLFLNTDTTFVGTPFVEGPNAIVIPTSLFTKTELHGYIEHDRLDETPLYSDEEGKYEFYSVDRDGNKLEDACGDCDFHIIRFDISAEEAMEILGLLLNCLIDAETNETAVLYSYISTKDDGISATMMNLPSAAMLFIPLDSPYVSAEIGATPRPFDPLAWWLGVLVVILCIITFGIAYLIITIVSSIADITNQNNQNAQSIGMTILTWLAHLTWLLVRAAILVFAYVLLAIKIFNILLEYVMYLVMAPFILLLGGEVNYDVMSFEYSLNDIPIKTETTVRSEHVDYFDIELPLVIKDDSMDNTLTSRTEEIIGIGLSREFDYGYPDMSSPSDAYTSPDGKSTLSNINVSPNGGDTQTVFRFTITYTDIDNRPPESGYPKLHVIHDGWDESERIYNMTEANGEDDDFTDGKEYFYEISYDQIGDYNFYFDVKTPTDTITTDRYQLSIEDLSFEEKMTSLKEGMYDSMAFTTAMISILGLVPLIPHPTAEMIAGNIMYGILLLTLWINLRIFVNSKSENTPYRALGWSLGVLISAGLLGVFCKFPLSFDPSKTTTLAIIKFITLIISAVIKANFGSIKALFDPDNSELDLISLITSSSQFLLLVIASLFSASTIFGKFNIITEESTKMIARASIMTLMCFGFGFLIVSFMRGLILF